MYKLLISDEARLDIFDAYLWYESCCEGLGVDFELCLDAGFEYIQQNPLLSQKRYKKLRIHFIKRFPYGIHYLFNGNDIKYSAYFTPARILKTGRNA